MSGYRKIEIYEPPPRAFFIRETSIFRPPQPLFFPSFADQAGLGFDLDFLNPNSLHCSFPPAPSEIVTDLIQIEKIPFSASCWRVQERTRTGFYLENLSDRVSALQLGFNRFVNGKINDRDRKFSWTDDIKSSEKKNGVDRKYKWTAEIKGGKKDRESGGIEKTFKWTAEIKPEGKNAPVSHTYTIKASTAPAGESSCSSKKAKKKGSIATHTVEVEEPIDQGLLTVLRKALARRTGGIKNDKGKQKELTAQDAALIIQIAFRAYLIRRSQTLRALRDLALAKAKLKEVRSLFNNFSYCRRIASNAEEQQRISERIIVLLLTVDAVEGPDLMVRAAKRSMVEELEAMLDVVDPQPARKLGSMKRRMFDLPEAGFQEEIAGVVRKIVEEKNGSSSDFEICL